MRMTSYVGHENGQGRLVSHCGTYVSGSYTTVVYVRMGVESVIFVSS